MCGPCPIGFTIKYGNYMVMEEFDARLEEWIDWEMDINSVKLHTAWGYTLKDVAVQYIFETNNETFNELGVRLSDYIRHFEFYWWYFNSYSLLNFIFADDAQIR